MFSSTGEQPTTPATPDSPEAVPLMHLLPRLKEYLQIVDPDRVDRAMELLVNAQTEDELFSDLQAQYGDLTVETVDGNQNVSRTQKRAQSSDKGKSKKAKHKSFSRDEDLSDFIVSDSEEIDEEEDSEIQEPEPDEDLPPRARKSPSPRSPAPPVATSLPLGPTVVCKYGKACYRKNPVHFQEFAHPWLLNQPGK